MANKQIELTLIRPMVYDTYRNLSHDDKRKYINFLSSKYKISCDELAEMMGCSSTNLKLEIQSLKDVFIRDKLWKQEKKDKEVLEAWYKFASDTNLYPNEVKSSLQNTILNPIDWNSFIRLPLIAQKIYILRIFDAYHIKSLDLERVFGKNVCEIYEHCKFKLYFDIDTYAAKFENDDEDKHKVYSRRFNNFVNISYKPFINVDGSIKILIWWELQQLNIKEQKSYIQLLQQTFNVNTVMLSELFKVSPSCISMFLKTLDISSNNKHTHLLSDNSWKHFIKNDINLHKQLLMDNVENLIWDNFKKLSIKKQISLIKAMYHAFPINQTKMAEIFDLTPAQLQRYMSKTLHVKCGVMQTGNLKEWDKFVKEVKSYKSIKDVNIAKHVLPTNHKQKVDDKVKGKYNKNSDSIPPNKESTNSSTTSNATGSIDYNGTIDEFYNNLKVLFGNKSLKIHVEF